MQLVEVQSITRDGVCMLANKEELFLQFESFPWFLDAKVSSVLNVELKHEEHLYWPDLDVDLDIDRIRKPEQFPLVYRDLGEDDDT